MRALNILIVLFLIIRTTFSGEAQEYVVLDSSALQITDTQCNNFTTRAARKCDKLAAKVRKTTDASLAKFQKAEDKILQGICNIDERHAESLMRNSLYSLRRMEGQVERHANEPLKNYLPEFDSLNIATQYIESRQSAVESPILNPSQGEKSIALMDSLTSSQASAIAVVISPPSNQQVNNSPNQQAAPCACTGLSQLKASQANLKKELKRAETVSTYIKERNTYLHKLAEEYPQLKAMMPSIEKIDHYLGAQTKEYMSLFADRSNPEKLLFAALNKVPGFADFANVQGALAGFNVPSATTSSPAGQTMEAAMAAFTAAAEAQGQKAQDLLNPFKQLKNELSESKELVEENFDEAKNLAGEAENIQATADSLNQQVSKSKNQKINKWTPNPLKAKRFIDRVTYGFNLQADPHTTFFPTTGTLSGQAAYQLTTKMNVGLGASYLVGFQKTNSTSENQRIPFISSGGYNFRSYYDYNIHRRLFLQVNYELNYRRTAQATALAIPSPPGRAREGLLAGLKLKTPSTKRTQKTMEILYDFMHERTGQPALVVRLGMELRPKHGFRK